MIIEYAGPAERFTGAGVVHEVRAWWNINDTTEGRVMRAAINALTRANGVVVTGTAEVIGMDISTYNTPSLNAMVRIRVLTAEQVAKREELKARRYTRCDECGDKPGYLVRTLTGEDSDAHVEPSHTCEGVGTVHRVTFGKRLGVECALCYGCWRPLADANACKVLYWIQRDGKLQIN